MDAEAARTRPTTVALCHILTGLQRNRTRQGDTAAAAGRAAKTLNDAARVLHKAGYTEHAEECEQARAGLAAAARTEDEVQRRLVRPGWQLDAFRHRITWTGEAAGEPILPRAPAEVLPTPRRERQETT